MHQAAKIWCFLLFHTSCNLFQIAISVRPEDRFVFMSDVYPSLRNSLRNSTVEHTRSALFVLACGRGEAQAALFGPDSSKNTLRVQLPGITFFKNQKSRHLIKCWWLREG